MSGEEQAVVIIKAMDRKRPYEDGIHGLHNLIQENMMFSVGRVRETKSHCRNLLDPGLSLEELIPHFDKIGRNLEELLPGNEWYEKSRYFDCKQLH